MRRSIAAALGTAALAGAAAPADLPAEARRWWAHVEYLAGDALEGRNTGSAGHRKAAEYVAHELQRAGLAPAGSDGFFQPVRFRTRRIVEERSRLALVRDGREEALVLGEDAYFNLRNDAAAEVEAPAVFAGYGLSLPEAGHDDLAGIDLRGKIAVFVSGGPAGIPGPLLAHGQSAGERWKALARAGAIGIATIPNPRITDVPWARATLARFQTAMSLEDPALDETAGQRIALTVNHERADKLLAGTGHAIAELLARADRGEGLPRFPLGVTIRAAMAVERGEALSDNVAGLLRGSDPALRDELLVLSAHLDHVGVGRPIEGDAIYNGAMDNASGVATLLELARALGERRPPPRRSVLVLAVTAEEKGLLGSRYFAQRPSLPGAIVANLNFDMPLPLFALRSVLAFGLDESDLGDRLRATAAAHAVGVQADPEPLRNRFIRSDQYSFIRRGVPALAFKFGYQKGSPEEKTHHEWTRTRYHAPSDDTRQPVDREGAARFNRLLVDLALRVADDPARPGWKETSFFSRYAR